MTSQESITIRTSASLLDLHVAHTHVVHVDLVAHTSLVHVDLHMWEEGLETARLEKSALLKIRLQRKYHTLSASTRKIKKAKRASTSLSMKVEKATCTSTRYIA